MHPPEYITALLSYLESELDRVMWNIHQKEYDNPFRNSGNVEGFKTDVFEVHAYDWDWDYNEESGLEPVNFKCGDFELTWYKYLGRGMWANEKISEKEAVEMFNKCLFSIWEYEEKVDPDPLRSKPSKAYLKWGYGKEENENG